MMLTNDLQPRMLPGLCLLEPSVFVKKRDDPSITLNTWRFNMAQVEIDSPLTGSQVEVGFTVSGWSFSRRDSSNRSAARGFCEK